MLFPEEIFVKEFLPNIRVILAHELYKRNYSQTKIAEILGITQARINGYLKSSYEKSLDNLQMMGLKKKI
jgi:Predicted transcriptional regulator